MSVHEPSPSPEERKLVTIFFADVVASTQLSGALDPEHLREQIARFFGVAREVIERYGGTVEKFIGDAVMAVFGLPTTHEDDPERAVQAALSIRSRVRPYIDAGIVPEIRIGINTGDVVANPLAIEKGEFLVTGEVVNLAARLQQQAKPGEVLVGESTYAATQWAFEYRSVPQFQVKGKQEKMAGYVCVGRRAEPLTRHGFLHGISSPLVGRRGQFTSMKGCVERLLAGRGGIVSVIGEAGLGKSRLVAEARRQVTDTALRWLEGRALSFTQAISYWPFQEIIKSAAGITEKDGEVESWAKLKACVERLSPTQVAEIVPYLGTLLGLGATAEWQERVKYLDGEAMGRQIYRSSRLFFESLARERPLVLVFEDLHWIDQSSAQLLEHLLPLAQSVPLLFCGLGRPDPQTPAARLRDLATRDYADRYTEIILTPLSPVESTQLVRNLLEMDDLPARFREVILQKTEGNPFFVEEIIRALIDMGAVVHDEGTDRWQISPQVEQINIPGTLRGVIMARVDRLDEAVKQVLKTAAVIGRTFFYRVLENVAEAGQGLDRDLAELQRLELILERRRVPELEYIFKHALTQEATYESILLRRRRELHRRVGETIEALFADHLEEFYGVLAYHYARAEDWEKAQDYLFKAGDQAGKMAADAEALAHYRQAVAGYSRVFGDRWDPLQRAVLERKMGEALFRRGEHQQATEYLQRALTYLGIPFPTLPWGVRLEIARQILQQAGHRLWPRLFLRQTPDHPQPAAAVEERFRIYEAMGWIDYFVDVKRLFLEALMMLNMSERNHYLLGIARGSTGLGLICDLIPAAWLAGRYHRRAIALAEQIQHPLTLGQAYLGLGLHELHALGKWESALEDFRRSAAAYREAGELRQWGAVSTLIAWVLRARGDFTPSLEHSREILRVGQETADPQVWGWGLSALGRTLLHAGALEEAVAHLQKANELFKSVPDDLWVVFTTSNLAECYVRQGKLQEAIDLLEAGLQLSTARGFRGYHVSLPRLPLAEAYLAMAERAEDGETGGWLRKAKQACRVALKQGQVTVVAAPSAARFQGTYEWLRGKPSNAQKWWQRSLIMSERLGARYESGMTYLEMGKRMGKREYLERAEAIFTEIDSRWYLAQARECLKRGSYVGADSKELPIEAARRIH